MATVTKIRWGELDEEDGEDLGFLLPAKQVIGPDANSIKKVIEFRFNNDGINIANARLSKHAVERRSWSKFGGAAVEDASQSRRTVVSTEEIVLEET